MDTIHLVYDSLKAFDQFSEKVHFSFRTLPSQITLKDISPFVPILAHFKEPITLDMQVKERSTSLPALIWRLRPTTASSGYRGCIASGTIESAGCVCVREFSELSANNRGVGFLVRNLSSNYNGVPPLLERLGDIDFRGERFPDTSPI